MPNPSKLYTAYKACLFVPFLLHICTLSPTQAAQAPQKQVRQLGEVPENQPQDPHLTIVGLMREMLTEQKETNRQLIQRMDDQDKRIRAERKEDKQELRREREAAAQELNRERAEYARKMEAKEDQFDAMVTASIEESKKNQKRLAQKNKAHRKDKREMLRSAYVNKQDAAQQMRKKDGAVLDNLM